ncbi:hypothetical protein [Nosocomiicoccus ampullae]|uniref:hypothetical protein n=1 Tax=Nosocomiicoccus ampullae TaxID=489910 RepID=UPI00254C3FCD|nr:hypothetical protein [Nosocomiicoccus ampullae]MDK6864075.1 hypothetical protein [Nosocomiicoccus ampullae]
MSEQVFNITVLHDIYIYIIFFIIFCIMCIFIYVSTNDKFLLLIILLATLFMLIMLITHKYFYPLPFSGNDDLRFELLAYNFYNGWLFNLPINIFQNSYFYSMILGCIYYLFGYHELIPGMFNIYFYILSIYFLYKIYLIIFNTKKGIYLTIILCVLSIFNIIFTVITLREIQVTFAIILMLYFALKFNQTRNSLYVINYLLICVIGSQFHIGLIAFIAFITIQYFLIKRGVTKYIVPVFMLFFLIMILNISSDTKIESVLDNGEELSVGEYQVSNADYSIPIGNSVYNPIYSFLKVLYFLIQPLPWGINSVNGIVGLILNVFLVLMLIGIYKLYKVNDNQNILITFLFIVACIVIFSIGTSNYGTGFRHKYKFIFLFFLFIPALTYYKEYFKGVLKNNV